MKKINIVALNSYPAFKEVMASILYTLNKMGFEAQISDDTILYKNMVNIVFAAHHISLHKLTSLNISPENIILYNLEQVGIDVPWMNVLYFELMKNTHVWEYSSTNFLKLKQAGIHNLSIV